MTIRTSKRRPWPAYLAALSLLTLLGTALARDGSRSDPTGRQPVDRRDTRSRQEVLELVEKAGKSRPDWWSEVRLDYPKTLDLSWPKPKGPWDTRKNVGQYLWSIINENPRRWQQGTKFMHYVRAVNKDRSGPRRRATEALAHCYHDLLADWARGAYWLRKIDRQNLHHVIGLADCYWKLGNIELAREQLARIKTDSTRYGGVIKLWSDMGDLERALKLAESSARSRRADAAYMGAGDACRRHGLYDKAIAYYTKVLELPTEKDNDILKRNKERARINRDTIRVFEALDPKTLPAGTYAGKSLSYNGDLSVEVAVGDGRIRSIRITKHLDKQYYAALTDIPAQIVAKQSLQDIDATTGATITAEAIVNASARALSRAVE